MLVQGGIAKSVLMSTDLKSKADLGRGLMNFDVLNKLNDVRIAIIGDVMIDVFVAGAVERVSPEAPVPVVRSLSQRSVPGGAANVAANILSLGASVDLVGVIGDDSGRQELQDAFLKFGGYHDRGLVVDKSRMTTKKKRILAQHQQVVRIDYEDTHPLNDDIESEIVDRAKDALRNCDVAVLSDYGKGVLSDAVLQDIIAFANKLGKTTIVDPKRRDLRTYRGATLMTPNRSELTLATGLACETDAEAELAAKVAQEVFGGDILLTRADRGMSFFAKSARPMHVSTAAQEVFDVSGAGDTVVAVLAAMLAAGVEIEEAVRIANHAAGIVVGKVGTATLTNDELLASLSHSPHHSAMGGQLLDWQNAAIVRGEWKKRGFKVGFANGCFDLLHPGHISLISQAAAACDRLILALNSDASVRRLKGPTRPVQDERARAEVIGAIKGVDLVVLFNQDTPLELIELLKPDVLVKGADYAINEVVGADVVTSAGGRVLLAKLVDGQSTTRLIKATA
jgi:D-beta-D-heptose 7-phosphate kinase/D-beta-D-heptose 1-phosphate adenosyltransferase